MSYRVLCDPQRRAQETRPHCEWVAMVLVGLTRREKEVELRVRSLLRGSQPISIEISLIC